MSDNQTKTGGQDRTHVALNEELVYHSGTAVAARRDFHRRGRVMNEHLHGEISKLSCGSGLPSRSPECP